MEFEAVIGLEFHSQLKTKSKLFCECANDTETREPNVNICPICTGMPGTLPNMNRFPIELMIRVGTALNADINQDTKWDRKHYFYPDLPKGYQITQYDEPIVQNGYLEIDGKRFDIIRVHLEEDTGRLTHPKGADYSYIDLNRAGTPLMELVTHPVFSSAQECRAFAEELQKVLRWIGASDADMENGNLRCDANVSVRKLGETDLPPYKVEVKNMNSFRSIEQAVQYEIERQSELLRGGEIPVQETRGWDENGRVTVSQRTKETAEDYRYFPEPDIPPLLITDADIIEARQAMPEAVSEFRSRMNELIASDLTEGLILDSSKREYVLKLVEVSGGKAGDLLKFFYSEPLRGINKLGLPFNRVDPQEMLNFFNLALSGTVPKKVIKERTEEYLSSGLSAEQFFEQYMQSGEINIPSVIEDIVAKNPNAVEDYRKGKSNSVQFLVGQTLKTTKGFGDPGQIREQIVSHLELSK